MGNQRDSGVHDMLARFPKTRPALPPKLQAIYARQYLENRSGATTASSLAQRLESWMHIQVAGDARTPSARATLEIGAGTLNQLAYEALSDAYDVIEPFTDLFQHSPARAKVRHVFTDISEAPADARYDRITSVASMEHICDLPVVLARSAQLLTSEGVFRAAIPSEGGFLWALGWMATTGLEFRLRHGLDYGLLMRHEHVNTACEVETLVRALFEKVEIRTFGVGRQLSLYRFIAASAPRLDVAAAWIARFA